MHLSRTLVADLTDEQSILSQSGRSCTGNSVLDFKDICKLLVAQSRILYLHAPDRCIPLNLESIQVVGNIQILT